MNVSNTVENFCSFLTKCVSYIPSSILNVFGANYCKCNADKIYLYKCVRAFRRKSVSNEEKHEIVEIECRANNFFFNINVLNQGLSLILENQCKGKLINLKLVDEVGNNIWEYYFKQPVLEECTPRYVTIKKIPSNLEGIRPNWRSIYNVFEKKAWCSVYRRYVRLNEQTQNYIVNEISELGIESCRVLGVLCRGTDYIHLRPLGHPIQPAIEEVISEVRKQMKELQMDYIYLATDEEKDEEIFRAEFPDKILTNKRTYYSEEYQRQLEDKPKGTVWGIGGVKSKNSNYDRGLEYLSSITILSKCTALIAGNCGGTCAAVFMNDNKYEYCHVFDLGLYE